MEKEKHFEYVTMEEENALGEAYVCDKDNEVWVKKLINLKKKENFIKKIESIIKGEEINYIGYIKNVYVEPKHRRKGKGTRVLKNLMEEMFYLGAELIILESDEGYPNKFNVTNWYVERFKFKHIEQEKGNPILYYIKKKK